MADQTPMTGQDNYSERAVQKNRDTEFRILSGPGVRLRKMAPERPVTAYVRFLLREKKPAGLTDKAFAARIGVTASSISQIVAGKLGVGAKTAPLFARAFGMSLGDFTSEAERWHKEHGEPAAELVATEEADQREAIEVVCSLGRATEAQLRTIVAAYGAERFRGRDKGWWVKTLLEELERDRALQRIPEANERQAAAHRAAHRAARRDLEETTRTRRRIRSTVKRRAS